MEKAVKTFILLLILGLVAYLPFTFLQLKPEQTMAARSETTFWEYQCIDTMKISRDKARAWAHNADLQQHIDWEMKTIADLGANCVAIDTPYDAEFLPYMQKWVRAARKQHLHIWFRGNFAGWEKWFDYPKMTSTDVFFTKLEAFIVKNPDLFEDGDIFTGAPEGENGGPFDQVEIDEHAAFRAFLIKEYEVEKRAFKKINKNVVFDWHSMNGGLAKRMLDQDTVDKTGKVVAIDHYIKNANEMGAFIDYFHKKYGSKVAIGEFGAPIPDINGSMTEDEQAQFVELLMKELYEHRQQVVGVNYWDLYDGSTAIMNLDKSPRKAAAVIKKYYTPAMISGVVKDTKGNPAENVSIKTPDAKIAVKTDVHGNFSFPIVADSATLLIDNGEHITIEKIASIKPSQKIKKNIILKYDELTFFQKIQHFFQNLFFH
jgi:hypothetical protein